MATKDELRRDFSERLKAILFEKGWSQSDLARRCWGKTQGGAARGRDNVSTWMNANSLPSFKNMKVLCRVLGVEPDDLIPGGLNAAQASTPAPLKLTSTGDDMARAEINAEVPMDVALKLIEMIRKVVK